MKHKTAELTGALLDAAVALAEGWTWRLDKRDVWQFTKADGSRQTGTWYVMNGTLPVPFSDDWMRVADFFPSSDWAQGGPILDRERLAIVPWLIGSTQMWSAHTAVREYTSSGHFDIPVGATLSPTPLIAAMRAYVSSKLGDEVELP